MHQQKLHMPTSRLEDQSVLPCLPRWGPTSLEVEASVVKLPEASEAPQAPCRIAGSSAITCFTWSWHLYHWYWSMPRSGVEH